MVLNILLFSGVIGIANAQIEYVVVIIVSNITCPSCADTLEEKLKEIEGASILDCGTDIQSGRVIMKVETQKNEQELYDQVKSAVETDTKFTLKESSIIRLFDKNHKT